MRSTDVIVVGAGLAGSAAAAILGRAGIETVLVDPHDVCRPDFRCEKFDASQVALLHRVGLADVILPATTPVAEVWIARYGRVILKWHNGQLGMDYASLVNAVRAEARRVVGFTTAKATSITTSAEGQHVKLSTGETLSARLVVLATGLNNGLRQALGIARQEMGKAHSTTVGFDIRPTGRAAFDFEALTYYPERPSECIAYVTLFPIGPVMRVNMFTYHEVGDPWLRALRAAPAATLFTAMPGLRKLAGPIEIASAIQIRPADLYVTKGHRQAGVVLVGDAFATSCPAAGTGLSKVLTDVGRLCNVHVPRWLASPGMGADKIAAFYDDREKLACDGYSAARAHHVRAALINPGITWRARRLGKFLVQLGFGVLLTAHRRLGGPRPARAKPAMPLVDSKLSPTR